jgi:UDP-N-acetylglucosamine/UDP-N-acetyl-alpha-D-glucosaminouronate 4-epimerase
VANYLVTGGAGFIGSHLVEELLRRGESVRIADDFSTGRRENLPPADRADLVEGDLAEGDTARRAVAGCDFVIHQAAIPSVFRSVRDPDASHRANVDATLKVLIAARDAGVRRLVFAGSSSVYGNAAVLPKREDMRPMPLSPYALQKLIGEQYCQLFTRLYGLETVTTRYFNVFGPRQQPGSPYSGVISLFIEALHEERAPTIYGDGRQTRDFTYVSDVVTGVLRCCEASNVAGEVINVAAGGRISLLELVRSLQIILKTAIAPVFAPARDGDVRDSQADIFKARELLGYESTVPLSEGLQRTVAWHRTAADAAPGRH